MIERLRGKLAEEIDASSLVAFRALFGGLMAFAAARVWWLGWIEQLYVAPPVHFPYAGFGWVTALGDVGMHAVFAVMFVSAILVALGRFYRPAIVVFFAAFTYVELIDQVTYLNHYYLISLLALLMAFMPLGRLGSLGALVRRRSRPVAPAWCVYALRFQLGLVYFFAGLAKLDAEWLLEAEPLSTWLAAQSDVPLVGTLGALPGAAHVMAFAGAAFDLSAPFLLCARRTRRYAYGAVVGFHVATAALFQLGMFPWVMIALTTIFFAPNWPRDVWLRLRAARESASETSADRAPRGGRVSAWVLGGLLLWGAVQLALPLRYLAYPGDVLWTEEGMRFSWRVMLVEKAGSLDFFAVDRESGARWLVPPDRDLTFTQRRMMATTPSMILAQAHRIRARYAAEGRDVEVHADARVSLHGRPARPLVDPCVDLAAEPDRVGPAAWVSRSADAAGFAECDAAGRTLAHN